MKLLSNKDFKDISEELGIEQALLRTVAEVESGKAGFLGDGRPVILFEAHIFSNLTNHKYDESNPNISSRTWNKKLYKGGTKEYDRLIEASKINKAIALKSASWGKFQIMGFNYNKCGYNSIFDFADDMYTSEKKHLNAFIKFIKHENIIQYLIAKNWKEFARRYNGPGYLDNKYDTKLEIAYNKYKNLYPIAVVTTEVPNITNIIEPEINKRLGIIEIIIDLWRKLWQK